MQFANSIPFLEPAMAATFRHLSPLTTSHSIVSHLPPSQLCSRIALSHTFRASSSSDSRGGSRFRILPCRARVEDGSSEGESDVVRNSLDKLLQNDDEVFLDALTEKVLQDDESKALLRDFATAAERVEKARQQLESIGRRERELAEIKSRMARAIDEETAAAALVREMESDVLAAEEEMKAAELALVTARTGDSLIINRKWLSEDIDEDLERIESGKAATVSALAGTLASIPFLLTGNDAGIGSLLSIGGVFISCALFGVTYRYILRRDLGNLQIKSGAAAAFAFVRGIGQVDAVQRQVGFPNQGLEEVLVATLSAFEGLLIFSFSAVALDYFMREAMLSPFPCKKSQPS